LRTVTDLPHRVPDLQHVEIPVRDGTRLRDEIDDRSVERRLV
jgi:hypothetical protein